jgi:hypothetical protein
MRATTLGLCLFLALPIGVSARQVVVAPQGTTLVSMDSRSQRAEAKFTTHAVDIGKSSNIRQTAASTGCTYSRVPCSLVDVLEISVDKKLLLVPRSAVEGIADVNSAELVRRADLWTLVVDCGDASESHRVEITFNGMRVLGRRVFVGGGKTDLVEETKYYEATYD